MKKNTQDLKFSHHHMPEVEKMINDTWPTGAMLENNPDRFLLRMRYIQREMLEFYIPAMNDETKRRAMNTVRMLEKQGI